MTRRFLAWLVRPQCTPLAVAVAFLAGNLPAFGLPWWGQAAGAALIGVTWGVVTVLIPLLPGRR